MIDSLIRDYEVAMPCGAPHVITRHIRFESTLRHRTFGNLYQESCSFLINRNA